MIKNFGHHVIPLLPASGAAGSVGGMSWMAEIKLICKSVERIQGALRLAGRKEIAVSPADPDFFDKDKIHDRGRNAVWGAIKESKNLQWIILTHHPLQVTSCLPPDWHGKGYKNVCIGIEVKTIDELEENIAALLSIPVSCRMLHILPSAASATWNGRLDGVDWVVLSGTYGDVSLAASIREECLRVGATFHFPHTEWENSAPLDDPVSRLHPFDPEIRLDRPPMPEISGMVAKIHTRVVAPENTKQVIHADESTGFKAEIPPPALPQTEAVRLDFEIVDDSGIGSASTEDDFYRLDKIVRKSLGYFIVAGRALAEIRNRELWRAADVASWADYCLTVGGLTKVHANRLIRAAEIAGLIAKAEPTGFTPDSESQLRPLCRLEKPEQCTEAWSLGIERAGGQPTAKLLRDVVAELMGDDVTAVSKPPRQKRIWDALKAMRESITTGADSKKLIGLLERIERLVGKHPG